MSSCVDEPAVLRLGNVDNYLGDRETRFFGKGYKRTDHRIIDILVAEGNGGPLLIVTAAVAYPPSWSRKADIDQTPHLSTVDVLVLGVQVAELWLARFAALGGEALRSAWIRTAQIKAGAAPVEDGLDAVPVVAWRANVTESPAGPNRTVSVLECTVSTLFLRIELDHPTEPPGRRAAGPVREPERRGFGEAYRGRSQHIRDVTIAADRQSAHATVELRSRNDAAGPGTRISGAMLSSVNLIDAFVVALQLGQILLYELDGFTRAESHTLWMRSTRWQASTPSKPDTGAHLVSVKLRDAAVLHNRKNETWRRADIVSELGSIAVTCSIAHKLPTHATKSPATNNTLEKS